MAILASHQRVRPRQREGAEVVVEVNMIPTRWVVANRAILPILSIVRIILPVTGVTIHRSPFELPVCVAGFAGNLYVPALESECRQVVIELCRRPALRRMTLAAIEPKAPLVRLIVMVTRVAVLLCHRKITKAARVGMALDAGDPDVFTGQLERIRIVIEITPEAVHAIVTVETD